MTALRTLNLGKTARFASGLLFSREYERTYADFFFFFRLEIYAKAVDYDLLLKYRCFIYMNKSSYMSTQKMLSS